MRRTYEVSFSSDSVHAAQKVEDILCELLPYIVDNVDVAEIRKSPVRAQSPLVKEADPELERLLAEEEEVETMTGRYAFLRHMKDIQEGDDR